MGRKKFDRLGNATVYQELDVINVNLVAGAALADVVTLDITPVSIVTITLDVTVAALTGLEVWARSGKNGRWFPIAISQLYGAGRTDQGTDANTTPAGAACTLMLERKGWTDVLVKAKSAGAAKLQVTVGGY